MLEYENQMLLDLLTEDGLLIVAKGLGIERILVSLIETYNDVGNLVLVIGTNQKEEEYLISQLEGRGLTPLPRCITSDNSVAERSLIYLDGGVLFVTSRILVMDMLMNRIPADLITGIIVWKAHRILESSQDAFILRLYRQKNKKGFVKALSASPLSFTAGFCQVERVMRNLFVKKLYLWPRFQVDVKTCMEKYKPDVIELHIQMTSTMKQIQVAILDLITETVAELKRSNRTIDTDEFCVENAISKSFEKMIKVQLEPIWHQLSTRTKQLVADLKVLRTILVYLTQYDCVTFYNLVNSLRSAENAMQSSGWMLLNATDTLFINAKLRVFGAFKSPSKNNPNAPKPKSDIKEPQSEVNPKWLALSEVLDEVKTESEDSKHLEKCLVITADDRTAKQLKEYLVDGAQVTLKKLFYTSLGPKLGMKPPEDLWKTKVEETSKRKKGPKKKRKKGKKSKTGDFDNETKDEEELTLTQITKKYEFIGQSPTKINKEDEQDEEVEGEEVGTDEDDSEEEDPRFLSSPLILVQSLRESNDPFMLTRMLNEIEPNYIVMYDSDLNFIRQIEVWQSNRVDVRVRVYFIIYKGTVEEQIYLTNIKREKDAFEHLIKQKSSMVIPEYLDGRDGDHPDLSRDPRKASEMLESNQDTRKGGVVEQEKAPPRIIVDMREFRSELPSLIHKRGIDIDPVTIEVGDYILTPEICVERKSLSDLIGSLNSGRLYSQATSMCRYYKRPILLIEFDQNKPFHLQGRFFLSNDGSSSAKDVGAKLQLLTIHFTKLRILWCPSPYATAEIFEMLKTGKDEPVIADAQAITAETNPDYDSDNYNPQIKDFVTKLPGINSKNINILLRKVADLSELLSLSLQELTDILGNSKNAASLHGALHKTMKPPDAEIAIRGKGKFTKKGVRKFRL